MDFGETQQFCAKRTFGTLNSHFLPSSLIGNWHDPIIVAAGHFAAAR
jgi:hypothetical protein